MHIAGVHDICYSSKGRKNQDFISRFLIADKENESNYPTTYRIIKI
jgi:hypothetical protein